MPVSAKISVRNLHKAFGAKQILKGVDLEIEDGDSWVLLGASGSGKSVLLKCILGLIDIDAGNVLVNGIVTNGHGAAADKSYLNKFGMLFQRSALFDSMTVWENIVFRLMQAKVCTPAEGKQIALEKLSQVNMGPGVADLMPAELSGGMQKRVALARAIAGNPEILLLDEPTAGLDPILSNGISRLIADITEELQTTVISITNDIDSALVISEQAAMLHNGFICWQGPTEDIAASKDPHVQRYIHGWLQEQEKRAQLDEAAGAESGKESPVS
jgi:phospholipid/cholesterol/gamma-HCH transport system ATP-binding protein